MTISHQLETEFISIGFRDYELCWPAIEKFVDSGAIGDFIGSGGNGVAYGLPNNRVLKITTDHHEAACARAFVQNPHPNIATHFKVAKRENEDLWYIVKEFIPPLKSYEKEATELENYSDMSIPEILKDFTQTPLQKQFASYLRHLQKLELDCDDLINIYNMGQINNQVIIYDIS